MQRYSSRESHEGKCAGSCESSLDGDWLEVSTMRCGWDPCFVKSRWFSVLVRLSMMFCTCIVRLYDDNKVNRPFGLSMELTLVWSLVTLKLFSSIPKSIFCGIKLRTSPTNLACMYCQLTYTHWVVNDYSIIYSYLFFFYLYVIFLSIIFLFLPNC